MGAPSPPLAATVYAALATPREAARAEAFALQHECVAWRRRRGLAPDRHKVAAVDLAVGDRFEDGDYVFPLLPRAAEVPLGG